jgi:hypothetical protein
MPFFTFACFLIIVELLLVSNSGFYENICIATAFHRVIL